MHLHAALVPILASAAAAQLIGFDEFTGPVTDQYASLATFSSEPGWHNEAQPSPWATSAPNALVTFRDDGTPSGVAPTYVDFAYPVGQLSFWAIEADVPGVAARFAVWEFDTVTTIDFVSTGEPMQRVDLWQFPVITRLEIFDILDDPIDEHGIAWDTFEFVIVPAPAPLALLASFALAAARRLR